jgi:hypothetical protein
MPGGLHLAHAIKVKQSALLQAWRWTMVPLNPHEADRPKIDPTISDSATANLTWCSTNPAFFWRGAAEHRADWVRYCGCISARRSVRERWLTSSLCSEHGAQVVGATSLEELRCRRSARPGKLSAFHEALEIAG